MANGAFLSLWLCALPGKFSGPALDKPAHKFSQFKFSADQAKRSFYRAANSIFARVGRLASEEVMVQLLKQKCLPMLYALEVCNLDKKSVAVA